MIIGSISENKDIEKRISITPDIIKKYISIGFKILIEKDYGSHLGFSDEIFAKEGCDLDNKENVLKKSDIILQLNLPTQQNLQFISEKKLLIGVFNSHQNKDQIVSLLNKKITMKNKILKI